MKKYVQRIVMFALEYHTKGRKNVSGIMIFEPEISMKSRK